MTGEEYRTAIAKLGLSQVAAAKFLQVSERQGRRFAADGPTPLIAVLLRFMVVARLSPVEVYVRSGMDPSAFENSPLKAGRPAKENDDG